MKKAQKLLTISSEHKEALAKIASMPEYNSFLQFLRIQQNNIVMLEWFRTDYTDPLLREKKAYYKGLFDEIKAIIQTFEESKKGGEE